MVRSRHSFWRPGTGEIGAMARYPAECFTLLTPSCHFNPISSHSICSCHEISPIYMDPGNGTDVFIQYPVSYIVKESLELRGTDAW